MAVAQAAIDEWVAGYNHQRPHQALNMATPGSRFRPNGTTRTDPTPTAHTTSTAASALPITASEPAPAGPTLAVQFDAVVPPCGEVTLLQGRQRISLKQGLAGRTVTVWVDVDTVHILLDGTWCAACAPGCYRRTCTT